VLKLAEPAADLAWARADFLHRLALREIDVARMFFRGRKRGAREVAGDRRLGCFGHFMWLCGVIICDDS
jgi:hypothetical protein